MWRWRGHVAVDAGTDEVFRNMCSRHDLRLVGHSCDALRGGFGNKMNDGLSSFG